MFDFLAPFFLFLTFFSSIVAFIRWPRGRTGIEGAQGASIGAVRSGPAVGKRWWTRLVHREFTKMLEKSRGGVWEITRLETLLGDFEETSSKIILGRWGVP